MKFELIVIERAPKSVQHLIAHAAKGVGNRQAVIELGHGQLPAFDEGQLLGHGQLRLVRAATGGN